MATVEAKDIMKHNKHADRDATASDEIAGLLRATHAEATLAIKDGSQSVNLLTQTFTKMVRDILDIKLAAGAIVTKDDDAQKKLMAICETCLDKAQESVVGFQFYDKLVQRIEHIATTLDRLSRFIADEQGQTMADAWEELKSAVYGGFNMEEDRALFRAIMEGMPLEAAIKASQKQQASAAADNIELF